jgi:hypothetical protein
MRKKVRWQVLITILWALAQTAPAFAQTKTISGIISDQNGSPLEKATIKSKEGKASRQKGRTQTAFAYSLRRIACN